MEQSAQIVRSDDPKFGQLMIQMAPTFHAVINDVLAVVGGSAFKGMAKSQDDLMNVINNAPGDVCWNLNKVVANPAHRIEIARRIAARAPAKPTTSAADAARAAEFRKTGFLPVDLLTPVQVKEMANFLASRAQFEKDGPTSHNIIEDVIVAPHTLALATHPQILSVVSDHLGAAPTIVDITAWWTDPSATNDYGQHIFHRDRDDFRACKLFLYMTDVSTDDGPHVFACNTHDPEFVMAKVAAHGQSMELANALFVGNGRDAAQIIPQLFGQEIFEIVGPAGSAFLENTYGFHRGKTCKRNRRGLFQVLYGSVPYPLRLNRMAKLKLQQLPADCLDTPEARYATRLMVANS